MSILLGLQAGEPMTRENPGDPKNVPVLYTRSDSQQSKETTQWTLQSLDMGSYLLL